ncbi:hypothetical protein PS3A_44540 [Pseudomonas sp. 3A(2025)]
MRSIRKAGNGPYQLERSHATPPTTSQAASRRWSSFSHKQAVLNALREEQYHLCCYSEIRADLEDLGFHIEHVENKSQRPQRTFEYANLAACALDSANDLQSFKAQRAELFGGHASGKSNTVDTTRFISCHQADSARYFTYLSDGRVVPADGLSPLDAERARYTIDLLNLNSPYLLNLRKNWWDELDTEYDRHLQQDMDLHCLAGVDLVPVNGRLSPFFSITRQFFDSVAEAVIAQNADELL